MSRRLTDRSPSRLPHSFRSHAPRAVLVLSAALALYACGESDSNSSEHAASGGQAGDNEAGSENGDAGAENGSGGKQSGDGGSQNGNGGTGLGGDGLGGGSSTPECGNGDIDAGEACDDGNTDDGDDCRADCKQDLGLCGNGDLDEGESCDEGENNSTAPNAACRPNCQISRCGDGIVDDDSGEVCDSGSNNSHSVDGACELTCKRHVCAPAASEDRDGDGFSGEAGDCNDCDTNVNPHAFDIDNQDEQGMSLPEADQVDENCDGSVVSDDAPCDDSGAPLDSADAIAAAKAIDICHSVAADGFGLVNATWIQVDGSPLPATSDAAVGHGLLGSYGSNVTTRGGVQLLALSSGTARATDDVGFTTPVNGLDKKYSSNYPQGLPYESPACPGVVSGTPHDSVALRVTLKAPTNATGYSFQSKFYTSEFPKWICSTYNDLAFALVSPQPAASLNGNVLFDSQHNLVTVNAGFLDVCAAQAAGGRDFACPMGTSELAGTGYETHGATSWLTTRVPVHGGDQITITLGILDAGDGSFDSTVLLDGFHWIANGANVVLGTEPSPQ